MCLKNALPRFNLLVQLGKIDWNVSLSLRQPKKIINIMSPLFFIKYGIELSPPEPLEKSLYDYLSDPDIKLPTYNNRLVYLRSFFKWCLEKGVITANPLVGLKKRKDEGRIVNIDPKIIKRLLE